MIKKYRKPYRVKRRRSVFKNQFFWLGILILLIFGGIFYLICFSSPFQIKEIKISGNQKIQTQALQNLIQEQIVNKFFLFTSRSIFLANFLQIKAKISETFPQIAQINLEREFPDTLTATVEERKPAAVFNQEDLYFFLDKEGVIFEDASVENPLLKIQKTTRDEELKLGNKVIEKEFLSSILDTESKLENNLKIPVEEVLVVSDERINLKTSEGWEIYLNPKGDVDWQLTKLSEVLEKEIPLEKRGNLQYIELRFGNFAPYKYQ